MKTLLRAWQEPHYGGRLVTEHASQTAAKSLGRAISQPQSVYVRDAHPSR